MHETSWTRGSDAESRLEELLSIGELSGILLVRFCGSANKVREELPERSLRRWAQTRAVTVADVSGRLESPGLELALLCDLVYIREGAELGLPYSDVPLTAGLVRALGRAGSGALAQGLLGGATVGAGSAVDLGLAQRVLGDDDPLPLPEGVGVVALTAARDLVRSGARGQAAERLELATFRLIISCGEPAEGARAFLEKREARFRSWRQDADQNSE